MSTNGEEVLMEVRDLCFSYKTKLGFCSEHKEDVVAKASFSLRRGQRLGIIGRNGEGKSTLLRLLAGTISPDSGKIWRAPEVTSSLLALGVGFNNFLTGRDNAILSAVLMGRSERWARKQLEHIKEFSELEDAFERAVRTYSAGMRSRLAFSTALNMDVDILLIDEVLAVGDAHFRKKASESLNNKLGSGQTVVLVSHSAAEIKRLCNSAIWLQSGAIEDQGDAVEIVNRYEATL
ncbi:MAG: ABC transporter ATP-binding protein [Rubritalea sp.]|uniref:ABC transporter ATP-binding protein n=1 Tax=Rubritalea sp. TaxID=2109375 RepID=UPI003241DE94